MIGTCRRYVLLPRNAAVSLMFSNAVQATPDFALSNAVDDLAKRLADIEVALARDKMPARSPSDEKLAALASALSRMRQRRGRQFPAELFSEPGWDMLLDLFINRVRGLRVATTSLCLASNAPQATALRYIAKLEEHGMLRKFAAPEDRRMVLIEISAKGFGLMRKSLGELSSGLG